MERAFENRFWLVPDQRWGVRYLTGGGEYRPSIKCSLRIHPVSSHERRHLHIDCYRVTPDFCPRLPGSFPTARLYRSYMSSGSGYGRLVNVDAWTCRTDDTEVHYQDVAAHEIGHVIGLGHVAQQSNECMTAPDSNADACYGLNEYQREDLMGYGNRVERWHAGPWIKRLLVHVRFTLQWALVTDRPTPAFLAWGHGHRPGPLSTGSMDGGEAMDASVRAGPSMDGGVPGGAGTYGGACGGVYQPAGGMDGGIPAPDCRPDGR
jgi:hypothetical protein